MRNPQSRNAFACILTLEQAGFSVARLDKCRKILTEAHSSVYRRVVA
jgi:hypothetical protein